MLPSRWDWKRDMPTCQGRLKGAHEQMKGDHSWGWCGSEGSTKHGMHGSLDLIRPARVFGLLTIKSGVRLPA